MRIGASGVMLPHYQPLKVAENFRMIAALHPGRVDLGLGNNPGIKGVQKAMDSTQITRFDYRGPVKKNYELFTRQCGRKWYYGQSAN